MSVSGACGRVVGLGAGPELQSWREGVLPGWPRLGAEPVRLPGEQLLFAFSQPPGGASGCERRMVFCSSVVGDDFKWFMDRFSKFS